MPKKIIKRAGLIPYYISESDQSIKMLFMRPTDQSYGNFVYQLIKGKIEEGEEPIDAAVREAKEEAGLFVPNIDGDLHNLGKFLGYTHVYVAKIKDPEMFGRHDEETESTKWMTPEEFDSEGRDIHKPVIKAAVRFIENRVKLHEQELQEILLVIDEIGKGFDKNNILFDQGQLATKSEMPLEVWKYPMKGDDRLVAFALRDPSEPVEGFFSVVVGYFDHNNFFVIQQAWTRPDSRRQGYITALYVALNKRLQLTLASDLHQGKAMVQVWKHLPLRQKVWDNKEKKMISRKEISDDEIYNKEEPERYRIIIEREHHPGILDSPDLTAEFTSRSPLYEWVLFIHPDVKGKYI